MSDHAYTTRKESTYQSQYGEDHWLEQYFGSKRDGFFVEVGAYDGVVLSNTYHFEQQGWTGILVEPHPRKAAMCKESRTARVFQCAAAAPGVSSLEFLDVPGGEVYSTAAPTDIHLQRIKEYGLKTETLTVEARTLNSMLEEAGANHIDFISIDVEFGEPDVLRGFDIQRWAPKVVIIEDPPERRPEIRNYFVRNGYAFLKRIGGNDLYAPAPLARLVDPIRHVTQVKLAPLLQHN